MNNTEALNVLQTSLASGTVPARDAEFVGSLVSQHKTRGLSEKQWYWVVKLAMKLSAPPPQPIAVAGGFTRVYAMFLKAREHLRNPKVHLSVDGMMLKLYLSGPRSRFPDVLNVVSEDGWSWFGRVYPDGTWERGNTAPEAVDTVEAALKALAENPEKVAAEHGKLTGSCCFCNRSLKDDRSTDVGYGPVCAKRFGLDWGK